MALGIRLKIARSLSELRQPEDWKWNRWLKIPSNSKEDFTLLPVKITGRGLDKIRVHTPDQKNYTFNVLSPEIILPEYFNKWLNKKSTKEKTSLISLQKSFRIFISKIVSEVSADLVPKDNTPDILFSFQPINCETTSIDVFKNYKTDLPELFGFEFQLTEKVLSKELTYIIDSPAASQELSRKFNIPETLPYQIPVSAPFSGENLIVTNQNDILCSLFDQYLFRNTSVTLNLLPTGDKIDSQKYNIGVDFSISDNLLSIMPDTIKINLLNPDEFRIENSISVPLIISSVVINKNYFVRNDSSTVHYVGKHKILVTPSKIFSINFHKLLQSSSNNINCILNQNDEHGIVFQALTADYINHTFECAINDSNTEEVEVENNPVLMPRKNVYVNNEKIFDGLYLYQKHAVNFLMNNNKCLMYNRPLANYKLQIIYSLSLLLRQGKIRCALIIRNSKEFISSTFFKEDEWISMLKIWAPEISFEIHDENETKKLKPINLIGYEHFDREKLKKFDCIIMDDYTSANLPLFELVNASGCKRIWISTLMADIEFNPDFAPLPEIPEINEDLPVRKYEYKWIQLSQSQILQYESQLIQGQMKIYASIERGEIYLIKPHLFTLLHQLLQTCNFASDDNTSKKSDVLLADIKSSKGKVIVLSQYEKFGLERIEKILNSEGIRSVIYRTGSSENEKSLIEFRSNEKIKVLLADVKAINSILNTGTISTIIHFDHWWNPVSQWQIEDRLSAGNHVRIIQYCSQKTIEEDIYLKLTEKELTHRHIYESLTPTVYSDILSNEEWLQLYKIKTEEVLPNKMLTGILVKRLKSFTLDEIEILVQKFVTRLGYGKRKSLKNISEREVIFVFSRLLNKKEENILIYINSYENSDQNTVKLFYEEYLKYKNVSKALFLTTGTILPTSISLFNFHSHKVAYFDGEKFAKLLHLFNII